MDMPCSLRPCLAHFGTELGSKRCSKQKICVTNIKGMLEAKSWTELKPKLLSSPKRFRRNRLKPEEEEGQEQVVNIQANLQCRTLLSRLARLRLWYVPAARCIAQDSPNSLLWDCCVAMLTGSTSGVGSHLHASQHLHQARGLSPFKPFRDASECCAKRSLASALRIHHRGTCCAPFSC